MKNEKKPNVLCIMSDEHTWNILGCYGNTIVKTPNLDRLAQNGALFANCYTPSPLCVPARLAFTAGQYASKCGAWSNSFSLASDDWPSSLFHRLTGAGYECVLGGKMHYARDRRYGFTTDLVPKHNSGAPKGIHYRVDVNSDAHKNAEGRLSERFAEFGVMDDCRNQIHDREVTQKCGEFLKSRKKGDKPFFLLAGYIAPHFPIVAPEEFDIYKDKVPMPVIPDGHLENLPMNCKVLRRAFRVENVPDEIVKRGRELYYGFVTWLDNEIGKLLAALGDSEEAANTIVIYTTDHGENLGEHGMWWKNNMYDTAAKIPLIIGFPDKRHAGKRIEGVCNMLDLVPTIAEWCGAEASPDWDGDSLTGLVEGGSGWRDYAVSEYHAQAIAAGHCMIRRGKYKYVYYSKIDGNHPAEKQLFDLDADPGEFNNLAGDPQQAGLIKELHALLVKELGRDPEEIETEIRNAIQK